MKLTCSRNIFFLKNHMQNKEKLFPDSFLKNLNWAYIWINNIKFIQFVFVDCQVDDYRSILKLSCWPLVFVSNQAFFLKKKKKRGAPVLFSAWYLKKKYLPCYILLPDQISLFSCLYYVRYWAIYVLQFFVNISLWRLKFWN